MVFQKYRRVSKTLRRALVTGPNCLLLKFTKIADWTYKIVQIMVHTCSPFLVHEEQQQQDLKTFNFSNTQNNCDIQPSGVMHLAAVHKFLWILDLLTTRNKQIKIIYAAKELRIYFSNFTKFVSMMRAEKVKYAVARVHVQFCWIAYSSLLLPLGRLAGTASIHIIFLYLLYTPIYVFVCVCNT